MARHRRLALLTVLLSLSFALLACWSSDTLFIPPTVTPPPTNTPKPLEFESLYQAGDSLVIQGEGIAPVYLTERPEPATRRNRVPNAACYPGSTVDIQAIQETDGMTYYQVICNNIPGWLAESNLGKP